MRIIAVALLIGTTLASAACHTMRPVTLEELGAFKPSEVVVTRPDQSVVIVSGPQLLGDTLVGYIDGNFEEMPTDNLTFVMKRPDKTKTTALIVGTTVGIAGVAMLLTSSGTGTNPADLLDCEDDPDQPGCMPL